MAGKVRREITVGGPTCLLGFSGRDSVDSAVFDTSTLSAGGVNEVQTVSITGTPAGGTFTLSFRGQVTDPIAYNANAAAVQAALVALDRIGPGGVSVSGGALPGTPVAVEFLKRNANKDVELLVANSAGLTGGTTPTVHVTETVKGESDYAGLYVIKSGLILAKTADGKGVKEYTGAGNVNEVQTVTITGSPAGGSFTLGFKGEYTANIAYNAAASAVQSALEALPNIDVGDVAVAGGALPGTPVVVTFTGDLGGEPQPQLTTTNALTGGTTPAVTVVQTVEGAEVEQIVGIFDGLWEFLDNTGLSDEPIPVYNHNCVFDKDQIQNYSAHEAALVRWGRDRGCVFKSQGV